MLTQRKADLFLYHAVFVKSKFKVTFLNLEENIGLFKSTMIGSIIKTSMFFIKEYSRTAIVHSIKAKN